jgi:Ca2+-binding RTX toxin-like protein
VVFGKAGGFASTLELSSLDGTNGFQINGEAAYDQSGWSVSSAGDVNGDGFDDLVIGALSAGPNGSNFSGASYVVFGKAGGFASTLELSSLDGTNGFRIDGEAADDRSGRSVSSAGDVNGDGFDDLVVGTPYSDPNGASSGASYVIFGRAPDSAVTRTGTAIGQTIHGGAFGDTLDGGGGADTLVGGGGDDIYIRDVKGDVITELSGGGNDIVRSSVGYTLGSNVENLVLTGTGDHKGRGNALANTLTGNDGDNRLVGLAGNDTFSGGAGMDAITGGKGTDHLTGGSGADTFIFDLGDTSATRSKADTIFDMTRADHIDLTSIDANPDKVRNQGFDFIGTDTFSGHAGELRYEKTGSDTYIYADINGDGKADFTIQLDDAMTLKADYFLL